MTELRNHYSSAGYFPEHLRSVAERLPYAAAGYQLRSETGIAHMYALDDDLRIIDNRIFPINLSQTG
ncbi:MAG: hypothetical protein ACLQHK_00945 [Gallionellaceae bacterium]